jgi:regulator of CtrA degradation
MSEQEQSNTIHFAEHVAFTASFKTLFAEGMALVEETANYLDGDGRAEAKLLEKPASVLYASESMRLTTRLMQLASWLLLQRSANEGDMTREQVASEKKKIKLDHSRPNMDNDHWSSLPSEFQSLVHRSVSLATRISKIDDEIYGDGAERDQAPAENPVSAQLDVLNAAFGSR